MTAVDEFTVEGLSRPAQPWTLRIFPQGIRLTPQRGGHAPIHLLLASVPLPGDPAAGMAPKPFDVQAAVLGAALIGGTLLSRWRPHRMMFLVDSLWFAGIAVMIATQVFYGSNPLWLIVVASQILFAWNGISLYRDFSAPAPP